MVERPRNGAADATSPRLRNDICTLIRSIIIPDRHRGSGGSEFLSSARNHRDGKLFFRDPPYVAARGYDCRRGWDFIDFIGNIARIVSGLGRTRRPAPGET